MEVREVCTWHCVLTKIDATASETATIDVACMLVNFIRPKVLVEAGTYRGHMALSLANILRQVAPESKIYTADPLSVGFALALRNEIKELSPWIEFHEGDYLEMLKTVPGPIDFAYIDASDVDNPHLRWEHAQATWDRLAVNGLMLVDDTASPDWPDALRFRDWAQSGGIHLPQLRGLTIIQKQYAHA